MANSRSIAVITGASSGIGAVYADRFAARGFDLLLVARREDRLHDLATKLEARHGITVTTLKADLVNDPDITAVEEALKDPRISVLINNAGTAHSAAFTAASVEQHQALITLNITALTRLSHAALLNFQQKNSGTLINISSILAVQSWVGSAVYSGTKGYVLNLTKVLQAEAAGTGIRIQAVLPAATATEIWDRAGVSVDSLPAGAVMKVDDLVDSALAGLDSGEAVTIPPLHDLSLWETYATTAQAMFDAAAVGQPAPRYAR